MHARRRDRDDGHVPLLQGGDLDYRSDLRKSQNVPCWSFLSLCRWCICGRLDCGPGTWYTNLAPYERWHWRENRRSPCESDVPQLATKLRSGTVNYESTARPSSVYRTVSSQPRLRSISSWSSGWFFGSAAAVALILLARLSVPFLLPLRTQVVDGGEHHVRLPALAYPESVLDPAKVKSLIAARL